MIAARNLMLSHCKRLPWPPTWPWALPGHPAQSTPQTSQALSPKSSNAIDRVTRLSVKIIQKLTNLIREQKEGYRSGNTDGLSGILLSEAWSFGLQVQISLKQSYKNT